jgi:plasmid stability protein
MGAQTTTLTVRLPVELRAALAARAATEHRSKGAMIRVLLEQALQPAKEEDGSHE